MASTVIDEYKIFPRIMMLVVTVLTYQATHWFMNLPDPSNAQAGPKPAAPAPVKDER